MKLKKLLSKNKDFCVVGNSPCEIGMGRGKDIDSHSLVIRFNDFSLDKKFHSDYGKNVNIWIRGTNDRLLYTFEKKKDMMKNLDLVIIRAKSDRNKNTRKYFKKESIPFEYFLVEYELELTERLGRCPSTGLLTLFVLKNILGHKIPRSRLYGFSFCKENRQKDPDGDQIHYYNKNNLVNPVTRKVERIKETFLISKHNWDKEEEYFNKHIIADG